MASEIENIKNDLLVLSKRYKDATGSGHLSDVSSLQQEILKLMGETETSNGNDLEEMRNRSEVNIKGFEGPDKNGHYFGSLNGSKCNFLSFTSRKEAEKALNQFRGSSDCFVRPISIVDYKTKCYVAVESFEAMEYNQDPSDERNECIRNIFKLAINLDLINQFNDGFEKLVMVSGRPKLCTLCDISVGVKKQACELAKVMKKIVKTGCHDDKFLRDFFVKLEAAYTITHLRNCFYHPLLMTRAERIFFHPRCMLLIQISYARIDHHDRLRDVWSRPDPSARPDQKPVTWKSLVERSGYEGLKAMLGFNMYSKSIFEWHRYVRNVFHHVNDDAITKKKRVPYDNLYQMMTDLEHLFPELLSQMHSYMIQTDLYCEFERQETDNTIMMTIHGKMERLTRDLPNVPYAEFLQMIDMFDFVLAKIAVYCSKSDIIESIQKDIRDDKMKVDGIEGNTLSDVTGMITLKKNVVSAALCRLQGYLLFFNECVCQLEGSTLTLQCVVHNAILTKCKDDKRNKYIEKVRLCGLPDRCVVDTILQFKYVTKTKRTDFGNKASKLGALLKIW